VEDKKILRYYLLDASALVLLYQHANHRLDLILIEKAKGRAFLYVPQFCVAEVFNTFHRLHWRDKEIDDELFDRYVDEFENHIANRKVMYCYDLHRYHNLGIHPICKSEHTIPYGEGEKSLSTFDILIISMGLELMKIHSGHPLSIVTSDHRIARICRENKDFPNIIFVTDKRKFSKSAL